MRVRFTADVSVIFFTAIFVALLAGCAGSEANAHGGMHLRCRLPGQ